MLTATEFCKIAHWIKNSYANEVYVSIVQGFDDKYLVIEKEKDCRLGREIFSFKEIFNELNEE